MASPDAVPEYSGHASEPIETLLADSASRIWLASAVAEDSAVVAEIGAAVNVACFIYC